MKKQIVFGTLAGILLALVAGAWAGGAVTLRVNVPFNFYVDRDLLPAGEYVFAMRPVNSYGASSSAVRIEKQDGTVALWVTANPGGGSQRGAADQITFNQYGDKYFLTKVECLEHSASLRATKAEKEMRAQGLQVRSTILTAGK